MEKLSYTDLLSVIHAFLEERAENVDYVEIKLIKTEKSVNVKVDMNFTSNRVMF